MLSLYLVEAEEFGDVLFIGAQGVVVKGAGRQSHNLSLVRECLDDFRVAVTCRRSGCNTLQQSVGLRACGVLRIKESYHPSMQATGRVCFINDAYRMVIPWYALSTTRTEWWTMVIPWLTAE